MGLRGLFSTLDPPPVHDFKVLRDVDDILVQDGSCSFPFSFQFWNGGVFSVFLPCIGMRSTLDNLGMTLRIEFSTLGISGGSYLNPKNHRIEGSISSLILSYPFTAGSNPFQPLHGLLSIVNKLPTTIQFNSVFP